MLISVEQAAKVLGLRSRGSIYRKIKSGELPSFPGGKGSPLVEREGLEDLWERITRKQENSPAPLRSVAERTKSSTLSGQCPQLNDGDVPDFNDERARHEKEKRLLAELARKEKEGELLRRQDAELAWSQAVNITRTRMLGVPSTAKQRIPHLEIEEVDLLTGLIREALDELAAGEVQG
jgi:phage terminase Nu1 subunit (DNA packaging protein)